MSLLSKLPTKEDKDFADFFNENKISNYQSFIEDINIIKRAENRSTYPLFIIPSSLSNVANKKPPIILPKESPFKNFQTNRVFNFTQEQINKINQYKSQNKIVELNEYYKMIGFVKHLEEEKLRKKNYEERELLKKNNADSTITFNIEYFISIAKEISIDLTIPIKPQYPFKPQKTKIDKTYSKDFKSISLLGVSFIFAIVSTVLFFVFWEKNDGIVGFLMLISIFIFLYSFFFEDIFKKDFWLFETQIDVKYTEKEIEIRESKENEYYQRNFEIYQNTLLPKYEKEFKAYENKIEEQQIRFNNSFPLIVKNIWLHEIISKTGYQKTNNAPQRGALENNLFASLMKLYPEYIKVDTVVNYYYPDMTLDINGKVFIDIEIDEPYDYKTKIETHYIGSKDDERNNWFVQNNWFVLRFSEFQIKNNLTKCIDIVNEVVQFTLTGNTIHFVNLNNLTKEIQMPLWSKEEARLMAINNYRSKLN